MITCRKVKRTLLTAAFQRVTILCIVLTAGLMPSGANAFEILIGTDEAGTFSHFTGRVLERIISRNAREITCRTMPASGDVHNLTNLKEGSLDIALVDSRMLNDAVQHSGYFEFLDIRYDDLRCLTPLYDVPLTLVVRADADITTVDQLTGKRINAGLPRSPRRLATATIMKLKKWAPLDFSLFAEISPSLSQDTMAFCHGSIQATVHIGVHPDSSLLQLIQRCGAKLVAINDSDIQNMVTGNPAFLMTRIQAATYPSQPESLETLGTRILLVASQDLDEQTAYTIIKALYVDRQRLQTAHPALALRPVATSAKDIAGVKLHPGALRYFSQQ